jgi:undecaprenyl-diphosphatase
MMPVGNTLARIALVLTLLAPLDSLDRAVQRLVQHTRRPALEAPMRDASAGGRGVLVFSSLLVIAVAGGPLGPATALTALCVLAPVNLAVEVLKRIVGRVRPDGERHRSNSSFPSSHAANAAALALVMSQRWRRWWPLFWALALVVCWSRMYLNRHFLTDVLGGVAIGVGIGWLVLSWLRARGWTWEGRARELAAR